MTESFLLENYLNFGLAALLGFLIGLEREMGEPDSTNSAIRDFIMFALIGAVSTFAAVKLNNTWLVIAGFSGLLVILASSYWGQLRGASDDPGTTTETAAILTFFIGVLAYLDMAALAIALAIIVLAVLSQRKAISSFRSQVQGFELAAALKLLVITFIVLPVLPSKAMDGYFSFPLGTVISMDAESNQLTLNLSDGQQAIAADDRKLIYTSEGDRLGILEVLDRQEADDTVITARYEGDQADRIQPGNELRAEFGVHFLTVMLSAIVPYKIWLIVVLVSFISFIGYVLVKAFGSNAGIGLTGLIGGLASSTVTTLSFARRSKESSHWNTQFAVAVILASSVMFPRLVVQIGIVNQELMGNTVVPICIMGITGLLLAIFHYQRTSSQTTPGESLTLSNPFRLKSAIAFAGVFMVTLMVTRLAIEYLGDAWLPVVAIVSGLTDADAIAFSVSAAQQAGLISVDWASFNLVLGAISNTFMKLILVLMLGDRGLFRRLLVAFLIIGVTGIVTTFLYYDIDWNTVMSPVEAGL